MSKNNFRKVDYCKKCKYLGKENTAEYNRNFDGYYKPVCELDWRIVFYSPDQLKMFVCDKFEEDSDVRE